MTVAPLVLAAVVNWADAPPVPGRCSEPAAAHVGEHGCFLVGELRLDAQEGPVWWHVYEFTTAEQARAAAAKHPAALAATSHGRSWLHILSGATPPSAAGTRRASIGPLNGPRDVPLVARFLESVFPPGMRTRVHSHPGPEAFYVVEGQQCMETQSERRKLNAGESFVVQPGLHVQAAPGGRKNIALILHGQGEEWMTVGSTWTPSQYCAN